MTSLKLTPQTQVKNVDVVTPNIVKTCAHSADFMKELTVVAISTLTLLKNTFPKDNNYVQHNFGGIRVWVLKSECEDKIAQFVSDSIRNSFDAIDKKYLFQLALCFYQDGSSLENLLEYYLFEFNYKNRQVTIGNSQNMENYKTITFENIQRTTVQLVQTCNTMARAFPSLPEGYDVIIRLYYNSDAPKGYHPPGFLPANKQEDNLLSVFDDQWDRIMLGSVTTPFHQLAVCSYAKDLTASYQVNPSSNVPWIECEDFITPPPVVDDGSVSVSCPCNSFQDITEFVGQIKEKAPLLMKCIYCHTHQHATCFGVFGDDKKRLETHCCNNCYIENKTRKPTDAKLFELNFNKTGLYMYRHTLLLCTQMDTIAMKELMLYFGINSKHAIELLMSLAENGVVEKNVDFRGPNKINKASLKMVMNNYFYRDKSDLAEQILMEIDSEECGDIFGDLLKPLEAVSLNSSKIYKIIEKDAKGPETTDETMQQFRNAIPIDQDPESDELPLSGSHNPVNLQQRAVFKRKLAQEKTEVKAKKGKSVRFNLDN